MQGKAEQESGGAWRRIASLSDIKDNEPFAVELENLSICLYRIDGKFYATDNICTHAFACLSEGDLDGEEIECPLHQGRFHVPTGKALGAPLTEDLRIYETRIEEDGLLVRIPEQAVSTGANRHGSIGA